MQTDPILEKNLESLIKTQTTLKQPSPAQQAALLSLLKQETAAFAQQAIFPITALVILTGVIFLGLGAIGYVVTVQSTVSAEPLNFLFWGLGFANLLPIPFFTLYIIQNRRKQTHEEKTNP